MAEQDARTVTDVDRWHTDITARLQNGNRFAGMYGSSVPGGCLLATLLATETGFDSLQTMVSPDDRRELSYPALTPEVPAAFWYERAAHDLSGVTPVGHPRLDPLLLPLGVESERPHPGHDHDHDHGPMLLHPTSTAGPVDVHGRGMFTIPFGPVRSGVFESIEFLIETPGEDIPHLNIRPHYKHRGIAKRFEGLDLGNGVLVAERVEGIASVAHALAFSHAAETIAGATVPRRAGLLRVVYAELERIANHLDVAMRLSDAAGLAVATARFGWHKEKIVRLTSQMCGSRFGRNVIVPGGVSSNPGLPTTTISATVRAIHHEIRADAALAMQTPSFLDRIRGTGILTPEKARSWSALGPIGRASGIDDDNRWRRPYDAYSELVRPVAAVETTGDAMARMRVRWTELDTSVDLIVEALEQVGQVEQVGQNDGERLVTPLALPSGPALGLGWAESPQGETLYGLALQDGRILRCFARSASFHNLVAFHDVFNGDVLTDFAFIEASFGLCYAGVAM